MDTLIGNAPMPTPKEKEEVANFEAKDKAFASIAKDSKWEHLTEYFDKRISHYEEELAGASLEGNDYELIGQKYMVCHMIAKELKGVKSHVEETARAVKEAEKNRNKS